MKTYDVVRQGVFRSFETVEAESPEAAAAKVARGIIHFVGQNYTQWFYDDFTDELIVGMIAVSETQS